MNYHKKILIGLSIISFCIFILFSYLVAKETFTSWDFDMTVKFQDRISHRFDFPFSLLSVFGSAEVIFIICAIICAILLFKKYYLALAGMFLLPLALAIEVFGKVFVYHPAPPHMFYRGVLHVEFPSHYIHTDYSYPSGHMTRTAFLIAFFAVITYLKLSWRYQLVILPILLGFLVAMIVSRIYLGEHWASDVIGGALIGISFGILAGVCIPIKKRLNSLHS